MAAYVPDLDHKGSTATRCLPPVSWLVSWVLRKLSGAVYVLTKGPRDENCSGEHRHLTHTVVFAVALGVAVWAVALSWLPGLAVRLGGAVAAGCVAHCLGDAATHAGCPFLWPVPIRGETFYELKPPLTFRTGGAVETAVVFPALVAGCVLLLPGVWPLASVVIV